MKIQLLALGIAVLLSGCGTTRSYSYKPQTSQPQTAQHTQQLTAAPAGVTKTDDAKMRPYEVGGKTYTPTMVSVGEEFDGIASWYGSDFHGKKTANGEQYDMNANTAAHKTLPMNTMVRVVNQNNKETAVVRINDRGPFVEGRIIDLSFTAGKKLGLDLSGTAPVKLTVLGFEGTINAAGVPTQTRTVQNFGVQIGAFKNPDNAKRAVAANAIVDGLYRAKVKEMGGFYRVFLEGFKSEAEARDFIRQGRFGGAFAVSLD